MASFSEDNFTKKLADLNPSQQSIQTLSLWLIHHRKHSKVIVKVWMKETKRVKAVKKLTMLYLANDVIQNSKKKGPEFNRDFKTVLPHAFSHTAKEVDEKIKGSMDRLCNIWKERGVFEPDFVDILKGNLRKSGPLKPSSDSSQENQTPDSELEKKEAEKKEKEKKEKEKREKEKKEKEKHEKEKREKEKREKEKRDKEKRDKEKKEKEKKDKADKEKSDSNSQPPKKKKKVELTLKEEIEIEYANGPEEPPAPEKLVQSLQDLETSASSDAAVRERIAALPPEVSDVNLLANITDRGAAEELTARVEAACELLTEYNARLAVELQERKHVARMLRDFIAAQKTALTDAETKLQEHKDKLRQVDVVRKELKSHIQSLPDMSLLPDVTGGLAPLPSAGDLFNIDQALGID